MNSETVLRALALCVVLAGTETLHGIARAVLLVPRVGKERATRLSILSGSLLAFAVCYLLVPGIGLRSTAQHLALGICLALFMAAFDLAMGMLLLRRPWRKALQDFNPATGNLLLFGLVLLVLFPALVARVRGAG
jgi:drug/metabolite transporter (DMT)-like permease